MPKLGTVTLKAARKWETINPGDAKTKTTDGRTLVLRPGVGPHTTVSIHGPVVKRRSDRLLGGEVHL